MIMIMHCIPAVRAEPPAVEEVALGVAVRGEGSVELHVGHVEAAAGAGATDGLLAEGARHRRRRDVVPHH